MKPPSAALTPPERLRLKNDSKQVAKVLVHVPPGDELEVSADVAAQLVAADGHFKDPALVPEPPEGPAPVDLAAGDPGLNAPADEPVAAPKKRPAKKRSAT